MTGTSRSMFPVKRVVATMLLTDPAGRVLIVEPTYKPGWELPGGAVEDGESPRVAARREVAEELGIDRAPMRLLAVDYVPASTERTEGLVSVFDGGVLPLSLAIRLPADELRGYAYVEPGGLVGYLPPLLVRRAVAAVAARASGSSCYLEDGHVLIR